MCYSFSTIHTEFGSTIHPWQIDVVGRHIWWKHAVLRWSIFINFLVTFSFFKFIRRILDFSRFCKIFYSKIFNFFLVSDSTGETLDRIYLALKAQFPDNNYKIHHFAFMRTTTQTATLIEACKKAETLLFFTHL